MKNLFPSKPSLGSEELESIQKVFDTNWLGMGSFVSEFETAIETFIGNGIAVAVNTGTSALHLALESIGVKKGDEVIVPSLTFCASVQVITALGATPVFCEVYEDDLNINIEDAKSKITPRTKAIIPVHYCGKACDMDALMQIKEAYGIRIIEDAAHAFGSMYNGEKIGSFGDLCCFSFDPIKNITCGEGGAIMLHDTGLANVLRKKRMLGIDKDGWQRHTNTRPKNYDVSMQGFRYHMSNINAAIGLSQLKKLETFRNKKQKIVKTYNDRLSSISEITLLKWDIDHTFPFAYVMRVRPDLRDSLVGYLKTKGVNTGINYIPNHLQSYFQSDTQLPVTEQLFSEIITLPLYSDLDSKDVDYVIRCIEDYFAQHDSAQLFNTVAETLELGQVDCFKNKNVLITGGLGFIGSNLALKLHQLGAKIEIIDALIPEHGGNIYNIDSIKESVKLHLFRIEDHVDELGEIITRQDYIFNLAGQSNHWDSMVNPQLDLDHNCSSHLAILETVRKVNPDAKVVYTSTRQIYGKPDFLPVNETHPIHPTDINGIHKAASEQYHLLYHKVYGLKTVALRLTNTYGPNMRVVDARQTFLGYWLRCAVEGKTFDVWDGMQKRDFNYIDDVVDALLISASNRKAIGKIYNLGSSEHYSLLEVAQLFFNCFNCEYLIKEFPKDRKSIDIGDYYSDYALINNELDWQPKTDLITGLKKTFDYLAEHLHRYIEVYETK